MTDLTPVRVIVTIAVENEQDRQQKVDELLELAGGPAYVLSIDVEEVSDDAPGEPE